MTTRDSLLEKLRASVTPVEYPDIKPPQSTGNTLERLFTERVTDNGALMLGTTLDDGLNPWLTEYVRSHGITTILLTERSKPLLSADRNGFMGVTELVENKDIHPNDLLKERDAILGIDIAAYGIARSGALLLVLPSGTEWTSSIPNHLLLMLPRDRIVRDLFSVMMENKLGREENLVIIAGPSKTADIEKTLVTGVHGPGKLTVGIL